MTSGVTEVFGDFQILLSFFFFKLYILATEEFKGSHYGLNLESSKSLLLKSQVQVHGITWRLQNHQNLFSLETYRDKSVYPGCSLNEGIRNPIPSCSLSSHHENICVNSELKQSFRGGGTRDSTQECWASVLPLNYMHSYLHTFYFKTKFH